MSFSSGSSGNCYYLGTETAGILIDAGVSIRRLKKGLEEAGLGLGSFGAVLVTHDHLDHIRHLGSFCRRLHKQVYTTDVLYRSLSGHSFTRDHFKACGHRLEPCAWNDVNGFKVRYFVVPHDATQTVGYAIEIEGVKFVIMTDMGRMTDEAVAFAKQADAVVIESNYDMDMLMKGPYTYDLKMRIVQGNGHLSNDECAAAIRRFLHPGLKNIFLCHLSENNNTPDLAYNCSAAAIADASGAREDSPREDVPASREDVPADLQSAGAGAAPSLRCLPRTYPSPLFIL